MNLIGKFSAFVLMISLSFSGAITPFSSYCKVLFKESVQYPYVLVHGLGGWGDDSGVNNILPYWGATTGSLKDFLAEKDYSVYEASVGPFSSSWDRACELYAQLTGTTVDYGAAHSAEHNHERYGRTYSEPLFEGWGKTDQNGQTLKVNLVGHSFGGPTVRLLTHLLENGAPEEIEASGEETSPLFTGGKGSLVSSVTALCSPNNGSTLVYALDEHKLTDFLFNLCLAFGGISGNSPGNGFFDFQLEQFGITQIPGEPTNLSDMLVALENIFSTGTDNAVYDLSPDGAAELNERIEIVDDVFYFSYAFCTTQKSSLNNTQIPKSGTLSILKLTARSMGKYSENTISDFKIDETWLENDGLVNVVSAKYPFDEPHQNYKAKYVRTGIWNVMPVSDGDHGIVLGLNADERDTHKFYLKHFAMVDLFAKIDFYE